jgi:hypothetical protein
MTLSSPSSHSLFFRRAIAVRTTQDLLADVGVSQPGDVPRRLSVLDAALRVVATTNGLVVLLRHS